MTVLQPQLTQQSNICLHTDLQELILIQHVCPDLLTKRLVCLPTAGDVNITLCTRLMMNGVNFC